MESILTSVKKMLGITEEYTALGVGPAEPYHITDELNTWDEFVTTGSLESVKTYVYLKVRLIFDPPESSAVQTSFQEMAKELEWRMNVAVETP